MSEEVIDSKILAGLKNQAFIFAITGETYSFFLAHRFHVQVQDTDYMKQRSIDTTTPNKLAVYFVADMVLADRSHP